MPRTLTRFDTDCAQSTFERMRGYNLPVLLNKMEIELAITPEEAKTLFEDVKKFLALSTAVRQPLAPPHAVDEGWHLFILFTKDYEAFCKEYCGHFVHHVPEDPFATVKDYESIPSTCRVASSIFGDLSGNWRPGGTMKCAKPLPPCSHCLNKCSTKCKGNCKPGLDGGPS